MMENYQIKGYWAATNAGKAGKSQADCKFFIGTNYKSNYSGQGYSRQGGAQAIAQKGAQQSGLKKFLNILWPFLIGVLVTVLCFCFVLPAIQDSQTYAYSYSGSTWQKAGVSEEDYKIIQEEIVKEWKESPDSFKDYESVQAYMDYMIETIQTELTQYGEELSESYGITDIVSYMHFYAQQISKSTATKDSQSSSSNT